MQVPVAGEVYAGRYRIERALGEGGFGWVLLAQDESLQRPVALKIMKPERQGQGNRRERFLREAAVVAKLSHPNTVMLYDFGESQDGTLFMVSEYVDGEDLDELLGRRGTLSEAEVRHVLHQLSGSLAEAHDAGVLHRDIKPENIRVFEYANNPLRVKLLDFGIARRFTHADPRLTATGRVIGTPRYMSPEQLSNGELTAASDIYSLGLVAYDMLFGLTAGWIKVLTEGPIRVDSGAGVSEEFSALLNRMLAREPERRVRNGAELASALRELPRAEPVTAPLPAVRSPRPVAAHPRMPAINELFEGRYRIRSILGEGGFGRVYAATDEKIGRDVAVKVLVDIGGETGARREARFIREAKVVASLTDPHAMKLYSFGVTGSSLRYMVCELLEGETLADRLARLGPMRPAMVARTLLELLRAVGEAHDRGVLHRDIKPQNIMFATFDHREVVKLIDFGLAQPLHLDATRLTQEGQAVGTAQYVAPEQILGGELSPATDLYALGLVAHEMLVGRPARPGRNQQQLLRSAVASEPIVVPKPVAPMELRRIVDRMCAPEPRERYADVGGVRRDLEKLLPGLETWVGEEHSTVSQEEPVGRAPTQDTSPAPEPAPVPAPFRRWILALIGVPMLGIVAFVFILPLLTSPGQAERYAPDVSIDAGAGDTRRLLPPPPTDANGGFRRPTDAGVDMPTEAQCPTDVPPEAGQIETTFVNGHEFSYYIPTGYETGREYPVLLVLHAWLQTEVRAWNAGDIVRLADERGFVIVGPRVRTVELPWREDPSDAVRDILEHLKTRACIDADRVYGLGIGAGGHGLQQVACAGLVSGVATANFRTKELPCEDQPPYIHFGGLDDPAYPIEGGKGCMVQAVRSLADHEQMHRDIRECDDTRKEYLTLRDHRCWTWQCQSPFVSCHIQGGGGLRYSDRGKNFLCPQPASDFPIAPTAWDFFMSLEGN